MTNKEFVARMDQFGQELPDPNPVSLPAGFRKPETLAEQVRRLVRSEELAIAAERQGFETFEEAEDFEIGDDMFEPNSPYEEVFDPVLGRGITHAEFVANEQVYRERYLVAQERAFRELDRSEALRGRLKEPDRGAGVSPAPSSEGPTRAANRSGEAS